MLDPLSLIASVVGITTVALQTAKKVLDLTIDMRDAPRDIGYVQADISAFQNILSSLNRVLRDKDMQIVISDDEAMMGMVSNLKAPIRNCRALLGELIVKINRIRKPGCGRRGSRVGLGSIRWGLFSKAEIGKLQQQLAYTRSTLEFALNCINMSSNMRQLAHCKDKAEEIVHSPPELAGTDTRSFAVGKTTQCSDSQPPLPAPSHHFHLEPTIILIEATCKAMRRRVDCLRSILNERQSLSCLDSRPLDERLKQCSQALDEQNLDMEHLQSAIERLSLPVPSPEKDNFLTQLNARRLPGMYSDWIDIGSYQERIVDVFFDSVSRHSLHRQDLDAATYYSGLHGPPIYRLETSTSFYPEQYTVMGLFSERVFATAITRSEASPQTLNYFLTYAETPRRWQRVVVSASVHDAENGTSILHDMVSNNEFSCKILPQSIQKLLQAMLPEIKLFNSLTNVSVSLQDKGCGNVIVDSPRLEVVEDESKAERLSIKQLLLDMEHIGCEAHIESDITVLARISSIGYKVSFQGQICTEQKMPFLGASSHAESSIDAYCNDIRLLASLRDCAGVAKFHGVVLDDTRSHLRSYLVEQPMIYSLGTLLGIANVRSQTIARSIRELWARQIIRSILNVHARNRVIGRCTLHSFGIRTDGSVILRAFKSSMRRMRDHHGEMPPELRNVLAHDTEGLQSKMNFGTDIFQLGLMLWLVMEHKPKLIGYICAISGCTSFSASTCRSEHANPVELPTCCRGTPSYLSDIIRDCRSIDPQSRPTANTLRKMLEATEKAQDYSTDVAKLLRTFPSEESGGMYCDGCGAFVMEAYYHCNICKSDNFDICSRCFSLGLRCFNPDHRLLKRTKRNGVFVYDI